MNNEKKLNLIFTKLFSITFLLLLSFQSQAEMVSHKIANSNLTAEANYFDGDPNKPAVIIIHGFLTTNKFHTVVSIANILKEEGFTTLAPTLTLGINRRKSSLKCNSIHTHTLQSDVDEIASWVNWLTKKGHKNIILIGHSSGSQEILEYLKTNPSKNVSKAIFTSLFYFEGKELGTLENEIIFAKNSIQKNQNQPHKYSFLFCKNNYSATPQSYLSYLKLDRQYILDSLKNLTIPTYTIMGSVDKRYLKVGLSWIDDLKATGTHVIEIKGANHFFSSEHEFDLQDHIINIVKNTGDTP